MTPDQYLGSLQELPYLLEHLASLVVPGKHLGDGQPRSRDMTPAPGRIAPLDAADAVFVELWLLEQEWRERVGDHLSRPLDHMVRRNAQGYELGVRLTIATEGFTLHAWALTIVNRIIRWWPDITRADDWPDIAARLDEWCVRPLRQWPMEARRPVPQRPRSCGVCGGEVWAGVDEHGDAAAVCERCEHVIVPERWVPISEAAAEVGVAVRTIERYAKGLAIDVRRGGRRRLVEVRQVREAREEAEAREARGRRLRELLLLVDHHLVLDESPPVIMSA